MISIWLLWIRAESAARWNICHFSPNGSMRILHKINCKLCKLILDSSADINHIYSYLHRNNTTVRWRYTVDVQHLSHQSFIKEQTFRLGFSTISDKLNNLIRLLNVQTLSKCYFVDNFTVRVDKCNTQDKRQRNTLCFTTKDIYIYSYIYLYITIYSQ